MYLHYILGCINYLCVYGMEYDYCYQFCLLFPHDNKKKHFVMIAAKIIQK